jgi:hypothetical protein
MVASFCTHACCWRVSLPLLVAATVAVVRTAWSQQAVPVDAHLLYG